MRLNWEEPPATAVTARAAESTTWVSDRDRRQIVGEQCDLGGNGGLGDGSTGGTGGNGEGGGILTTEDPFNPGSAFSDHRHSQITDNSAIGGSGGSGQPAGADGEGLGGGIAILGGTTSIGSKTKVKGNHATTAGDDIYTASDPEPWRCEYNLPRRAASCRRAFTRVVPLPGSASGFHSRAFTPPRRGGR